MKIGSAFDEKMWPMEARLPPGPQGPLALLPQTTQAKVDAIAEDIRKITRLATDVPLATLEDAHQLSAALVEGKRAYKELEESRRGITDPINAKVKSINKVFAPMLEALSGFEERAKRLLAAWHQQEEARVRREQEAARLAQEDAARREAIAMARAEASTGRTRATALAKAEAASAEQSQALIAAPVAAPRGLRGDAGSTGVRKRWTFEIVKPELVPSQYLTIDHGKIRAAVTSGVREIAGVNIYETSDVAVRLD